jgi:dimethylamine/trimethylamine dehydrogenase
VNPGTITTSCIYSEKENTIDANSVILVTSRLPNEQLYLDLSEQPAMLESAGIKSVTAIGDCLCPSTIASAVYEGHRVAREFDAAPENPDMPFRREEISLENFENQEVNR